jgi:endonuclease YncB( thermonuclease family)
MSRHWNPRDIGGGRPRAGWHGQWDRHRWPAKRRRRAHGPSRAPLAEILLMVAAGLLIGTLAAGFAGPAAWPFGLGAEAGSPRDVWVIDGDTFEFRGTRIRVADIDTPEVHGDCRYETELAARATTRMRALLAAGPFELQRTGTRDADVYGRKLRIVTRDGRSLGQTLVDEGLARRWGGHREPWC